MYKSRLQEICQQKLWSLPTYSSTRASGLDHCPQFRASVFVNGVSFDSSHLCKSSKEAQNQAAKLAFEHFNQSSIDSSTVTKTETMVVKKEISTNYGNSIGFTDGREFADVKYIYKNQLQNYAQKKGLSLPVYSSVQEGSPHAPRFKATVTVDGRTFESQEFFRTLKEAEHAAAKAALSSLTTNGIQEDNCALFKNLLQELAVKEGFSIPVYTTTTSGASHAPTFISSVQVEGGVFHGVESKTKKQAELNAAKVAYISLKERYKNRIPAHSGEDEFFEFIYPKSSSSQPNITEDFQLKLNLEGQASKEPLRNEVHEGIEIIYPDSSISNSSIIIDLEQKLNLKDKDEDVVDSSSEIITKTAEVKAEHHPTTLGSSSQDGSSSPTTVLECLEHAVTMVVKKEISSNYGNSDGREFADVNYIYKNQLQNYAQKKGLSLPVYSSVQEGSPHAPRFKATVTVDGRTFESQEFFRTLKEAEHAAAKAALSSLSTNGIQEDGCPLFKNLLQELAVKEGFSIPVYTTTKSGSFHAPTFTSSVEVEGDVFPGVESKTKKQAELNAAKVAYISLKERYKSRIPAQSDEYEGFEFIYPNSSSSQPNITEDFQLKLNLEGQAGKEPPRNEVHEGIEIIYPDSSISNSSIIIDLEKKLNLKDKDEDVVDSSGEIITKTAEVKAEHHPTTLDSSSQDGSSSPTTVLDCLEHALTEKNADQKRKTDCTLLCNRILVYPRKPDLNLPKGVTMLPISDDQWVAVSVDYPDPSDD